MLHEAYAPDFGPDQPHSIISITKTHLNLVYGGMLEAGLVEAGLPFLGLDVLSPASSWGTILSEGYQIIRGTPWPIVAGGIPLVLTTPGFTFLGEALRDVFDPRLRKRR